MVFMSWYFHISSSFTELYKMAFNLRPPAKCKGVHWNPIGVAAILNLVIFQLHIWTRLPLPHIRMIIFECVGVVNTQGKDSRNRYLCLLSIYISRLNSVKNTIFELYQWHWYNSKIHWSSVHTVIHTIIVFCPTTAPVATIDIALARVVDFE